MSNPLRPRRRGRTWGIATLFVSAVALVVWWVTRTGSGDPGGRIMAQILPAASALPGYGTPALPVRSSPPTTTGPYLIKSEPHQTSCDGRPGTFGWSSVDVQARFTYARTRATLFDDIGSRLKALGWTDVLASARQRRSTCGRRRWRTARRPPRS